jgi:hypothetical protein
MRVTFERTTKRGWFKYYPTLVLSVEFSDDEKSAIAEHRLQDYSFHSQPAYSLFDDYKLAYFRVRDLLSGALYFRYDRKTDGDGLEKRIRSGLQLLKRHIDDSAAPVEVKKTFEL